MNTKQISNRKAAFMLAMAEDGIFSFKGARGQGFLDITSNA